jgi:hypothetical protein
MADARDAVAPATLTDEADIEDWAAGTDVTVRLIHAMAAAVTDLRSPRPSSAGRPPASWPP